MASDFQQHWRLKENGAITQTFWENYLQTRILYLAKLKIKCQGTARNFQICKTSKIYLPHNLSQEATGGDIIEDVKHENKSRKRKMWNWQGKREVKESPGWSLARDVCMITRKQAQGVRSSGCRKSESPERDITKIKLIK